MKRNSLFLFLSMMFVWVGLCSAQTSSDKYVLIDGCFFNGMPPGIRTDEGAQMIMLTDEEGHTALEIRLNKGKTLPDYAMKYRVSVEKVPGGEELLQISRSGAQKPMAIAATNTVTLDKWVGKPFPDFKVKDTTGRVWTKADIIGKPFVLNYWHTGCRPCIKEMPELTHIADELFFFNLFKVQVTPTTLLVDKKGIIRYWEEGTSESKRAYLLDRLKELSAE